MTRGAARLLRVLQQYGERVFPKQDTLADRLGVGLRTINRYIHELKEAGLLAVEQRGPTSSTYSLISQRPAAQSGVASHAPEFSTSLIENREGNVWNGVACGVAFGVASPRHLLVNVLSSSCINSELVAAGRDGLFPLPRNPPDSESVAHVVGIRSAGGFP